MIQFLRKKVEEQFPLEFKKRFKYFSLGRLPVMENSRKKAMYFAGIYFEDYINKQLVRQFYSEQYYVSHLSEYILYSLDFTTIKKLQDYLRRKFSVKLPDLYGYFKRQFPQYDGFDYIPHRQILLKNPLLSVSARDGLTGEVDGLIFGKKRHDNGGIHYQVVGLVEIAIGPQSKNISQILLWKYLTNNVSEHWFIKDTDFHNRTIWKTLRWDPNWNGIAINGNSIDVLSHEFLTKYSYQFVKPVIEEEFKVNLQK